MPENKCKSIMPTTSCTAKVKGREREVGEKLEGGQHLSVHQFVIFSLPLKRVNGNRLEKSVLDVHYLHCGGFSANVKLPIAPVKCCSYTILILILLLVGN